MSTHPTIDPDALSHLPLGEVLRRLRKSAELNQQAVADAWDLSQSQVSDIECGRRPLLVEKRVRQFARAVRLSRSQAAQLQERWKLEQGVRSSFESLPSSPYPDVNEWLNGRDEDGVDPRKERELGALMARSGELHAVLDQQMAALHQTHLTLRATYTKLTEFLAGR